MQLFTQRTEITLEQHVVVTAFNHRAGSGLEARQVLEQFS